MKNLKKAIATLFLIALTPSAYHPQDKRVAHAGGALHTLNYTNSIEALDLNYQRGFHYFELDLITTRDGHIVCWREWEKENHGLRWQSPPSKKEFEEKTEHHLRFTPCNIDSLIAWLTENKTAKIITDIKSENIDNLRKISILFPEHLNRFIPQIYQPEEYQPVEAMGYDAIIWTLYKYKGSHKETLLWQKKLDKLFAITMSQKRASGSLPTKLKAQSSEVFLYAHTINDKKEMDFLTTKKKIDDIYTDKLSP